MSRIDIIRATAERLFERKSKTARGKRIAPRSLYSNSPDIRITRIPNPRKRSYRIGLSSAHVEDDANGVDCRICGRRLSQLPIHITRIHGISCEEYRELHGANAPLMCERLLRLWVEETIPTGTSSHVKKSSDRHEREEHQTCVACCAPFKRALGEKPRETCSTMCFSSLMASKAKEAVAAGVMNGTHSPARLEYLDRLKADRIRDRTRCCPVCGRTWLSSRRSKLVGPGVCSYKCRSAWVKRS